MPDRRSYIQIGALATAMPPPNTVHAVRTVAGKAPHIVQAPDCGLGIGEHGQGQIIEITPMQVVKVNHVGFEKEWFAPNAKSTMEVYVV
jgi:hypothetical protein